MVIRWVRGLCELWSSDIVAPLPTMPWTGVRPRLMPPGPKTLAQGMASRVMWHTRLPEEARAGSEGQD